MILNHMNPPKFMGYEKLKEESLQYVQMQKKSFASHHHLMRVTNHEEHNTNPNYYGHILSDIKENPELWKGKSCLDFGCGCGRNMLNLSDLADWENVHGCDTCGKNAAFSKQYVESSSTKDARSVEGWENDGISLNKTDGTKPRVKYDFAMFTVVFEHICSWSIRYSILKSIFDNLNNGGLLSFSVSEMPASVNSDYYEDNLDATRSTNANVNNMYLMVPDLERIGFKDIKTHRGVWEDRRWTYVKGIKE